RFLRWLLRAPAVRSGQARTDTLERIWPPDDWAERVAIPDAAWSTAAARLDVATVHGDPWRSGFRLNGPPSIRLEAAGERRAVNPRDAGTFEAVRSGDVVHLDIGGRSIAFALASPPDVDRAARAAVAHDGGPAELVAPMPGQVVTVVAEIGATVDAGATILTIEAMKMEHAVAAPIAGRVTDLHVRAGDQVQRGQLLAVVEP
ncbi:MAG TPA: biotin/lipoyl-containing protein, partial [Candidatus Limnocylindrales bacterium]